MQKRAYHHGDLRAALLARASRTLRERGQESLSLRELARDLGVSPGAPRRHFTTKRALLDTLALDGFERLTATLDAARADADATFAARLDAVARAYVAFALADPALLDLMFSAKHGPEASGAVGAAAGRWVGRFLDLIADGQRRGEVRAGPVEHVALTVFAPLHGYVGLAVSGALPPGAADHGLDKVIAAIARASRPD
ncbi:TetR/AcrR family transcriptional regulator [Actinomadura flavalba]|uniref:TetR/AcrR family transcriptional regulator n=1 Tax=Actinomadura flavalba TaxID=1120938 RepID=UPI00036456A8|nr:TetR/AcrR family transcriptional regulator [Actinomadura flavalba]